VPQSVPEIGELRVMALVGFLPPAKEFSPTTMFTVIQPDWIALALAAAMAGAYLVGAVRLARRGDDWPWHRTLAFVAGCVAFAWVLSGGAAAWGKFRFDAHMVQHMAMMMIVPPLWVLGAPVTMLSRATAPRTDGSRGVREWVLAALHSGYSRVISSPPMAGLIFAGSLVIFYFSPLFELAMYSHLGHVLMTVHFLASGYLFAWVLIGIDPSTKPINPVLKLLTLLVTLAFHAFFGVALYSATWLVAQDWYTDLGMYGPDRLMLIQERGASIMWAISEVPTVGYAIVVVVLWMGSEDRRARQYDRKAARDGGAELAAYNAYLASLGGHDRFALARTPGSHRADPQPNLGVQSRCHQRAISPVSSRHYSLSCWRGSAGAPTQYGGGSPGGCRSPSCPTHQSSSPVGSPDLVAGGEALLPHPSSARGDLGSQASEAARAAPRPLSSRRRPAGSRDLRPSPCIGSSAVPETLPPGRPSEVVAHRVEQPERLQPVVLAAEVVEVLRQSVAPPADRIGVVVLLDVIRLGQRSRRGARSRAQRRWDAAAAGAPASPPWDGSAAPGRGGSGLTLGSVRTRYQVLSRPASSRAIRGGIGMVPSSMPGASDCPSSVITGTVTFTRTWGEERATSPVASAELISTL
jgi:cytochrome c oxidase assembly factor CtaG